MDTLILIPSIFIPSNNQNKLGNSKGKIQTSFKISFYKWIFRQQEIFFTISEAYQFDPKHHRNIFEIRFEHLGSLHPFWWHFFETRTLDFFKTFDDGHFGQKTLFFAENFFWTPKFFSREHTNCHKIAPRHQKYPKHLPKKFVWPSDHNWRKNLKKGPPPPTGVVFEITSLGHFLLGMRRERKKRGGNWTAASFMARHLRRRFFNLLNT